MIRFKLAALIEKHQFSQGRRITITEIAESTGINRITLSKILNQRGYNTGTDNIDRLCEYFGCKVENVIEFVPANEASGAGAQTSSRAQRSKPQKGLRAAKGGSSQPRHKARHM